ncbi:MAG: DUF721 domain-containing protein [Acidimicrobiia bacterium]|nr:DUF721 domain-containing protein [Acidimicrobiia bacterium]
MTIRPWPLPDGPDPRRLSVSLDRVAASLGAPSAQVLSAVFTAWPEVVGDTVAAHARPRRLAQGTLHLQVDDPVWATQLRWLEADVLARLADIAGPGTVERIRIVVRRDDHRAT